MFVWYGSVLGLVGGAAAACLFTTRIPGDLELSRRWRARSSRVALSFALLFLVAQVARLWLQTYAAFGGDQPLSLDLALVIVEQTGWGHGWFWQLAAGIVAWLALSPWLVRRRSLALAAGLAAAASVSLTGHAAGVEEGRVLVSAAHSMHVMAAGLWLGSLGVVLLVTRQAPLTTTESRQSLAWAIDRFSPLAVAAVAGLLVAGSMAAVEHVRSVGNLFTPYGFVLMAKGVTFGAAGLCGLYNWRVVRPRLATHEDHARELRSMAGLELGFGVVALALTSVLTSMDMPGH